jgi:antitoxin component of RelBE/YafQ-DinJ toxin-antitoxin module
MSMRNITVSVDEDTYRRSRIRAAEIGTTVSGLIRSYLTDLVENGAREGRSDRLRRLQDETLAAITSRGGESRAADSLPRETQPEHDTYR